MTKKKLILLFLIISVSAISQNLENLDKKYGINIFKLGTPFSNYSSDCTFENSNSDGVKFYSYNKWYSVKIFNFSAIKDVHLGFYKGKLYNISIDILVITDDDFKSLHKKLKELFGQSYSGPRDEMYDDRYFWKTSKTYLGLERYSCSSSYKPCNTTIYLLSNLIDEQIKSDGF
jgi:hypothetical protein